MADFPLCIMAAAAVFLFVIRMKSPEEIEADVREDIGG